MRWGLAGVLLAACYAPQPSVGAQCANGGVCPTGLVCSPATNTCETFAVQIDATSPPADAAVDIDATMIASDATVIDAAPTCYGTGLLSICPTTAPTTPVVLNAAINTQSSPLCKPYTGANQNAYCVVQGTSVSVTATVRATGSKPLVILATGTITVDSTLDVSDGGANYNPGSCSAGGTPTTAQGGAGGSFTGRGGAGGGVASGLGPTGGATTSTPAVRGGCNGGTGSGATAGVGGRGGGAVYLIAKTSISVSATGGITAIGGAGAGASAPGDAASAGAGGGGGGSGGFIGFDAPTVTVAGIVFANGGGGGEGATPLKDGNDGGASAGPTMAGGGGSGAAPKGGDGGIGSSGATRAGGNASAGGSCGRGGASGGGGGGGAGMIYVHPAQTLGGQVAPPPS